VSTDAADLSGLDNATGENFEKYPKIKAWL
jgi:hypothetical protein